MTMFLVTGNPHKAVRISAVLGRAVEQVSIDLPEIQAVEVRDVIEAKARAAFEHTRQPVLVEDTALYFHAWNKLPGALIKWFLHTVGNEGICQMLAGFEDRTATAEACIGYFDGDILMIFTGKVSGKIVSVPRGAGGFGWDAIFQPDGWAKTYAELDAEESEAASMRTIAVRQLKEYLNQGE